MTSRNLNTTNESWQGKAIGLLDLDAFFASVERLDNPEYNNIPLAVGGSATRRGVIATASYEARAYGVHAAMSSAEALRLCPSLVIVPARHERYKELSTQIMDIIANHTPYVEPVSIDEAFFDVSPGSYSKENPIEICKSIQKEIDSLGLSCSIGLGVTKTVAKIASNMQKPHGLTAIHPSDTDTFLKPLKIQELSGVGSKTGQRMRSLGITTIGALANADPEFIRREFKGAGVELQARARGTVGTQVLPYSSPEPVKSISNERTFAQDLIDPQDIRAALISIAALVGRRLRKNSLKAQGVSLKVKFDYTTTKITQTHLDFPTNETRLISQAAERLLKAIWKQGQPVRLLGVGTFNFTTDEQMTFDLFEAEERAASNALTETADKICEKFGDGALSLGSELRYKTKLIDRDF